MSLELLNFTKKRKSCTIFQMDKYSNCSLEIIKKKVKCTYSCGLKRPDREEILKKRVLNTLFFDTVCLTFGGVDCVTH